MDKKQSKLSVLTNGFIKENPTLVLVLGTCPTIATTTMVENGIGMGLAATFVLLGSNAVIALLRKIIPDKVRIPCFIVVIAGFVTIVEMLVHAYFESLYNALGVFLPLIVVNCIILGRAEMFASKNSVLDSALDGIGMGIGFTIALLMIGTVRELFGSGTWMGIQIIPESIEPISILTRAPGGFFVFGCTIAFVNKFFKNKPKRKEFGCAGCPNSIACSAAAEGGCDK